MAGETPAKQYTGLLKGFEGHCIPEDFLNKDTSHSSFYTSSSKSLHDLLHALSPGEPFPQLFKICVVVSMVNPYLSDIEYLSTLTYRDRDEVKRTCIHVYPCGAPSNPMEYVRMQKQRVSIVSTTTKRSLCSYLQ